jgi:hypothetical protein
VKEKTKFSHVDFEFVSRVKFQPATDVSNFTRRPFPNNNNNNNSQNKRWASTFYYKTPIECNKRHKKKHAPPPTHAGNRTEGGKKDTQEERVVVLSAAKEKKRNRRSTTKFPGAITWKEKGTRAVVASCIVWRTYITTVAASISQRQSSKLIQVKQRRCVCV